MNPKWEPKEIKVIPHSISEMKYQRLVAEIGEILYIHFSQLPNSNLTCPQPAKPRTESHE